MSLSDASAVASLAEFVLGVVYAFCGSATVTVNGRVVPPLAAFFARLLAPIPMVALALISYSDVPNAKAPPG